MIKKSSLRPLLRVSDLLISTSSARLIPSGVSSNAQARDHRHGKSDNEQQHHKAHGPIRNFEERKNLTRYLHEQPCDDCVSNRNLVNVASLQLGKEFAQVHNELFRITRNDFLRQRLEAWIVAQRIQWREYIYIRYHDLFVLVTSLEPLDCFVLITETSIGYSDEESR